MITHTTQDSPEIIDPGKLVELARAFDDFLR